MPVLDAVLRPVRAIGSMDVGSLGTRRFGG